jgi:2,4-dienoyl-CoA reductase-like NADH-dependent reductase (Old Yellow Enzyme family)
MSSNTSTHPAASPLFSALTLPNGTRLSNRIAKAAMEENLADARQAPGEQLQRLYARWAAGGAGLLLSGNVMVDARAVTGPGAVVLEDAQALASFKEWAKAGRAHGAQFWLQISHPGRQVYAAMGQATLAPSSVALDIPGFSKLFGQPREMTQTDIADVVRRFARTAALAEEAGFSGVQIHAAHGYLLSQFLSPNSNRRQDAWGGSLENRARLLLDVVRAVRAAVKPTFCVAVKLNSADFQRGGFDADDALAVVKMLGELAVDLVELSGGTYESPAMQGNTRDARTLDREAYFLDFARDIARTARMPLMLTGGVLRRAVAERVLADGIAVVGIARALALAPDLPQQWRDGAADIALAPVNWKNKTLAGLATMAVAKSQLRRMARGRAPDPGLSPLLALVGDQVRQRLRTRQYRRWLAARVAPA